MRLIKYHRLTKDGVTDEHVRQINALLEKQHSQAFENDISFVRDFAERSRLVIAIEPDYIAGMISYVKSDPCLSHSFGHIKNFIIDVGESSVLDDIALGLLETLIECITTRPDVIYFTGTASSPMERAFLRNQFKKRGSIFLRRF